MNEENVRSHQFKKGQSGNPRGRPKGTIRKELDAIIKEIGAEKVRSKDPEYKKKFLPRIEELVRKMFRLAIDGDVILQKYLLDRYGGKPITRMEHTGELGGPIELTIHATLDDEDEESEDSESD